MPTQIPTMPDPFNNQPHPSQFLIYQIRIKGHLDSRWTDWFDNLVITQEEDGNTLLTGAVADQAALYGLLKRLRDLGLALLSVNPIPPPESTNNLIRSKE